MPSFRERVKRAKRILSSGGSGPPRAVTSQEFGSDDASYGKLSRNTWAASQDGKSDLKEALPQYPESSTARSTSDIKAARTLVAENDAGAARASPSQSLTHYVPGKVPRNAQVVRDLGAEITRVMKSEEHKIGLQEAGDTRYLPDEDRLRLVTSTSIRETLGTPTNELVNWILEKASKTFVITILAIRDTAQRHEAMAAFYSHRFRDAYLPVKDLSTICNPNRTICEGRCNSRGPRDCEGRHKSRLDSFHHSIWEESAFDTFYKKQWSLLLQKFRADKFVYPNVEPQRILPFLPSVKGKDKEIPGYFGIVQPARMLSKFQDTIGSPDKTIEIAIKTLNQVNDPEFNIRDEWHSEVDAHKQLGELDKEHLVQAIGAYHQSNKYYLLFEWADGGSLRHYWMNTDHNGFTSEMIYEYLLQLRGLTGALDMMHRTRQARSRHQSRERRDSSSVSSRGISVDFRRDASPVADVDDVSDATENEDALAPEATSRAQSSHGSPQNTFEMPRVNVEHVDGDHVTVPPLSQVMTEEENWRHGDIKPDNILRFTKNSSGLGTLKLADLGRAKLNLFVTSNRLTWEFDKWRTRPYEPPDLHIDPHHERSMSRLFDVWSLGCVFFESIVWILYGKHWLRKFETMTGSAIQNETPFWKRIGQSTATVSDTVQAIMDNLFQNDPEFKGERSSALSDLLTLVRTKMLVVDLPQKSDTYTRGKRANTETILHDLDSIIEKSKDGSYLFTESDRSNLAPPPDPKRARPVSLLINAEMNRPNLAPSNTLAVPRPTGGGKSFTQQLNTYSNALENKWEYEDDDAFAQWVYQHNIDLYQTEGLELTDQELCRYCQELKVSNSGVLLDRKVEHLTGMCALCAVLLKRARETGLKMQSPTSLFRTETGVMINRSEGELDLRLCRSPEYATRTSPYSPFIPLGLPKLPDVGSTASFMLFRSWLDDCNGGHGEKKLDCMLSGSPKCYPKRLLDVGSTVDTNHSHIVETESLRKQISGEIRYLALSHPWGQNTDENRHFVSSIDNIQRHMERILDDDLPRNFRDALIVARQLGIRYIWIDALCILQATDTDAGDFKDEARLMQDIFSSAYCVLAASSATGMSSGFLHSGSSIPRRERKTVELIDGESGGRVFVCDSPDDFQHDVIESPLSSRAWVLQERALARRTIFFTNNQVYWECSGGVRCESMSKLANSGAAFLGDSNFPAYAVDKKTKGAQIYLFETLYTDYCRLNFSRNTDKPFAIAGLEQCLTQTFKDTSGAGVFGKHKGRCLLWRRANDVKYLERISFQSANSGAHNPPSWSFMAYVGGITYLNVQGGTVRWADLKLLRLTGTTESTWLYASEPLRFHTNALDFEIKARPDDKRWEITYDDPAESSNNDKCVIIGSAGEELCFILVVRPIMNGTTGSFGAPYERAGVGYIPRGWLKSPSIPIEIL